MAKRQLLSICLELNFFRFNAPRTLFPLSFDGVKAEEWRPTSSRPLAGVQRLLASSGLIAANLQNKWKVKGGQGNLPLDFKL